MPDPRDTPEGREASRKKGYRKRHLRPSVEAQERYPIDQFPCSRCANKNEGLPFLTDNGSEFNWEHQHDSPGSSARTGCPRFNQGDLIGCKPKPGTATSLFVTQSWKRRVFRTEEEYLKAQHEVEANGADDAWNSRSAWTGPRPT